MNFLEDVWRYQRHGSNPTTALYEHLLQIATDFLGYQSSPVMTTETTVESQQSSTNDSSCPQQKYTWKLPRRTEILETFLCRIKADIISDDQVLQCNMDHPICSESCVGLKGPIRKEILEVVEEGSSLLLAARKSSDPTAENSDKVAVKEIPELSFPDKLTRSLLDRAEAVVMQSLQQTYWERFLESPQWLRCRHFLWYRDRPVVPNDFFIMRVLGRGGFGLVNGTWC